MKNNLYTACKVGDSESLSSLLAIFSVQSQSQSHMECKVSGGMSCDKNQESHDPVTELCSQDDSSVISGILESQTIENKKDSYRGSKSGEISDLDNDKSMENINSDTSSVIKSDLTASKEDNDLLEQTDSGITNDNDNNNSVLHRDTNIVEEPSKDSSVTLKEKEQKTVETVTENIALDSQSVSDNIENQSIGDNIESQKLVVNLNSDGTMTDLSTNSGSVHSDLTAFEKDKDSAIANVISDESVKDSGSGQGSVALPLNMAGMVNLTGNQLPDLSPVVTAGILSETFGDNETTLLHVAAREGHKVIVTMLMTAGADPAIR